MNDKQQIEEMAKVLCKDYGKCEKCFLYNSEETPCTIEEDCERLYEENYRKLLENAVVLTREEYYALRLQIQEAHHKGLRAGFDLTKFKEHSIAQARKETAKEILDEIGAANSDAERYDIWCKLCEKYGVEK